MYDIKEVGGFLRKKVYDNLDDLLKSCSDQEIYNKIEEKISLIVTINDDSFWVPILHQIIEFIKPHV